jgi:hypothetical protein
MAIFITFLIAIISFHVNHSLKRVTGIKVLINTIFDVYGNIEGFKMHLAKDVDNHLMKEIFELEKMHDDNYHVKKEIAKVKQLRRIYYDYSDKEKPDLEEVEKAINNIEFERLGKSFLILVFFNPLN